MVKRRVTRVCRPRRSEGCAGKVARHAQEPPSKPTALTARMAGTQRDGTPTDPKTICTSTSLFEGGKQQISAPTAHAADLRERECLDTRAVYLSWYGFGSSQARSARPCARGAAEPRTLGTHYSAAMRYVRTAARPTHRPPRADTSNPDAGQDHDSQRRCPAHRRTRWNAKDDQLVWRGYRPAYPPSSANDHRRVLAALPRAAPGRWPS
jgi:hypothetical protein